MRSVKTIAIAAIAASALCLGSAAFASSNGPDGFRPDDRCANSSSDKCRRPDQNGDRREFDRQDKRPGGNFNGNRPEPPKDGMGPGNGKRPEGNFNGNGKRPEPPRDARNGKNDADPHDGRLHEYPREAKRNKD
ncbi:MAG: hypothetical protein ACI4NA_05705 [Succinivibrio sp.]